MAIPAEKRKYSFLDYLSWDESDRVELLDGELIMMAPPARIHQEISVELTRQLANFLEGKRCRVYHAPFAVRLFEQDGDTPEDVKTVVEPDISVVCDPVKLDGKGCKGAPDMVMEILSPSTQRHDRLVKLDLYQRAGVREYWIVDPDNRIVQSFVLEDGRYSVKEFGAAGDKIKVNVLEDCVIDLSEVFSEA